MKKLGHKFGDDGVFWMSFEDMLETFKYLHRTRLFDEKWTVIQQWTSCEVSWITGYLRNKFIIDVKKKGTFIIILAQVSNHSEMESLLKGDTRLTMSYSAGRALLHRPHRPIRFQPPLPPEKRRLFRY